MKIRYKEYIIEVIDEDNYTLNSADNIVSYDMAYANGRIVTEQLRPTSMHGIRISRNGEEIKSVLICGAGGATTIHDSSFAIQNDSLFLCCCDRVNCIELPELNFTWEKKLDLVTCFGIYPYKNDFIVHGELEITRIDDAGNIKWGFSAREMFITQDGKDSIEFVDDKIKLRDWDGREFLIDENGREIR